MKMKYHVILSVAYCADRQYHTKLTSWEHQIRCQMDNEKLKLNEKLCVCLDG